MRHGAISAHAHLRQSELPRRRRAEAVLVRRTAGQDLVVVGRLSFEEGGRFLSDITDVDVGTIDTGTKVRMTFRIKDFDERRGFRRYFWKAVPV
jgi:uncharacterized OB-fold protein